MWSYLIPLVTVLLFLVAILLFRTAFFTSKEEPVEAAPTMDMDSRMVAEHLARIVRWETTTHLDPEKFPRKAFRGLQRELESIFPRTHRILEAEAVNDFSLLYRWEGSKPDLKPILLVAHQDVVPVEKGSEGRWEHPPFSGEIADGYVWGRGSLDNKFAIIGILEAIECLLQENFRPVRTIYLAFGHDEEIGGYHGAAKIAELLQERGVELELVLDEGGLISEGFLKGVSRPVALVGVAEKGFLTLELRAEGQSGHSSAPCADGAIGSLSRAITRLDSHPMPAHLDMVKLMYSNIASELSFGYRLALANTWLLGGFFKKSLDKTPTSRAMIHTTIAPTMLKAGIKDNVIPSQATAVINCRLLPGDSLEKVTNHVSKIVAKDGVTVRSLYAGEDAVMNREATPASDLHGKGYTLLSRVIRQTYPDALVTPYLVWAGTDARFYTQVCSQVLRFSPLRFTPDDYSRVHGTNERISVKACGDVAIFYRRLIEASANLN